jgi:glycosyltransferase involved in cell wall biosynthesis
MKNNNLSKNWPQTHEIYFIHKGYPELRNILYLNNKLLYFKKEVDVFMLLAFFYFKSTGKINYTLNNLHFNPFFNKNYHFFNTISLSQNSNFIVTFETFIPRLPKANSFLRQLAVKKMSANNCKKIIALSSCALDIQYDYLSKNHPIFLNSIMNKCIVLQPPQRLIIDNLKDKKKHLNSNDKIVFTLVGSDFFLKGGMEIVKVFDKLKKLGVTNWHLNIVSSMNFGDYATRTTKSDQDHAIEIIENNIENISLFRRLSNTDVITLFKKSHIGLLPTYADTYGYSVLEAQACGCPVISTNIRAMPEINNDECGWIIKVPKNNLGFGILDTIEERIIFSTIIEEEIYRILKNILKNPKQINGKSSAAIERIKNEHCLNKHSQKLKEIYKEAF